MEAVEQDNIIMNMVDQVQPSHFSARQAVGSNAQVSRTIDSTREDP